MIDAWLVPLLITSDSSSTPGPFESSCQPDGPASKSGLFSNCALQPPMTGAPAAPPAPVAAPPAPVAAPPAPAAVPPAPAAAPPAPAVAPVLPAVAPVAPAVGVLPPPE